MEQNTSGAHNYLSLGLLVASLSTKGTYFFLDITPGELTITRKR